MKVLLIDPSPPGSIPHPAVHFPLGIAYIAAVAKDRGHEVAVAFGQSCSNMIDSYLSTQSPDIIGIQTFINNTDQILNIVRTIKQKNRSSMIVLGGVQASNAPDEMLRNPDVDLIVPGEGEWIFDRILEAGPENVGQVPGIIRKNAEGQTVRNPGGRLVENLDDIPLIPYELFYSDRSRIGHILTHRGCPHHCSHCPLKFRAGVSIRFHSIERTVREIDYLKTEFGITEIEFYDENFTMDADHVVTLGEELARMNIRWSCTARITEINESLARTMARHGCKSILFGLGSGVPRLQDVLGTREDLKHSRELISQMSRAGVNTIAAFSMGLPTETIKEFNETIRYALSLDASSVRIEPCAPIPGTLLHEAALRDGRFLIRDWNEYRLPGQLIYLPRGRSEMEFRFAMWRAKAMARLKQQTNRLFRSRL